MSSHPSLFASNRRFVQNLKIVFYITSCCSSESLTGNLSDFNKSFFLEKLPYCIRIALKLL